VTSDDLRPFFEGWATRPRPDRIIAALRGADEVAFAWDGDRLVGLATAISDGALFAYLPLLEVLPDRRDEGIGTRLVRDLVGRFADRYGVDLCCDDDVVGFYERLGFARVNGMVLRRPGTRS
jgi:ribosomal protein S18 acetylase RimI-like enzyme